MTAQAAPPRWLPWMVGPLLLLAVGVGVLLVRALPAGVFGYVVMGLFTLPLIWILTSALWPASADRRCPGCGADDALARADPLEVHGVRCTRCGYEDESQSSWLLAEEEGPLEHIVLDQRNSKRGAPVDSGVDPD